MKLPFEVQIDRRLAAPWLAVLLFADLAALGYGFGADELLAVAYENGPVENMQTLAILLSCGLYLWIALREKRTALTAATLSLLCLSLLLRELDIDHPSLGVSYVIIFFVQGGGRNAMLPALWALLIMFAVRDLRRNTILMTSYLKSTSGLLFIAGGGVTALGWIFDHLTPIGALSMFCEEFIEMNGYALLLLAALHARRDIPLLPEPPATADAGLR